LFPISTGNPVPVLTSSLVRACRQAMMRSCFREFDVNGDGTIDRQELDSVFKSMGKSFSKDELDRMIALADKDKSGTMDYEEFVKKVFG